MFFQAQRVPLLLVIPGDTEMALEIISVGGEAADLLGLLVL
jgi:hypothetical protein